MWWIEDSKPHLPVQEPAYNRAVLTARQTGAIPVGLVLLACVGCSSGYKLTNDDRRSVASERRLLREWKRDHATSVGQQWAADWPVPSERTLRRRLDSFAHRHGLRVRSVEFLDRQGRWARVVVAASRADLYAARAAALMENGLNAQDPHTEQFAYLGFFFALRDRHNIPFLVGYREQQGPGGAVGASWARSKKVDPFVHGL